MCSLNYLFFFPTIINNGCFNWMFVSSWSIDRSNYAGTWMKKCITDSLILPPIRFMLHSLPRLPCSDRSQPPAHGCNCSAHLLRPSAAAPSRLRPFALGCVPSLAACSNNPKVGVIKFIHQKALKRTQHSRMVYNNLEQYHIGHLI